MLTSKSDPIGVWLVSATHQGQGESGASQQTVMPAQPGMDPSLINPAAQLKLEGAQDFGMTGDPLSPFLILVSNEDCL